MADAAKVAYGLYNDRTWKLIASGHWDSYVPPWDEAGMPSLRKETFTPKPGRSPRVGDTVCLVTWGGGQKHNLVGIVSDVTDDRFTATIGPRPRVWGPTVEVM